jgi:hypothetical protein
MERRKQWGRLLFLVLAITVITGADGPGILAADASSRAETWEFFMPIRYISGQSVDVGGGSKLDINSDLGWGFGFGYNLSEKIEMTGEFSWMNANYDVKWVGTTGTASATGELDASTTQFNFIYNFMPKTITPYISAGFGWAWVDSNIPSGSSDIGCYWDPWYGYICYEYTNTITQSGFNYGFGAGVRIEPKESFYFQLGLNENWQDYGAKKWDTLSYRLSMGWKF